MTLKRIIKRLRARQTSILPLIQLRGIPKDIKLLGQFIQRWDQELTQPTRSEIEALENFLTSLKSKVGYERSIVKPDIQQCVVYLLDYKNKQFKSYVAEWEARKVIHEKLRMLYVNLSAYARKAQVVIN